MKIARIFPTRTALSPTDADAYFDIPDLFTPRYDEIHISVTFTWDIKRADKLKFEWERIAPVKIGGVAIDGESRDAFVPGVYLRNGVVITSRGCPNKCPWCICREKSLIELPIHEGNIVQDNNLLACSPRHIDNVFSMLSNQRNIEFTGGFEADRLTEPIIEKIRGLRIESLFVGFDHDGAEKSVVKAAERLKKYFKREKLRCYVLIGFGDDTIDRAESRLKRAYEIGFLPFAMLYRAENGGHPHPRDSWRNLMRRWSRPAIYKSLMKEATR